MFRISLISATISRNIRDYSKRSSLVHSRNSKKKTPRLFSNPNAIPLITCKRPEFNLYRNDPLPSENTNFREIALASGGWQHYKSKHDYFIIHPHIDPETEAEREKYSQPFEKFNLDPELIENVKLQLNIDRTTYIQNEAIPKIQTGQHTLIAAETGCGKTIAYLLPIIQNILLRKRAMSTSDVKFNSPHLLILTPGRELAIQIAEVAEKLCRGLNLQVTSLTGGSTKRKMLNPTIEEVDILVGTVGVVSKLVTTGIYRMKQVRHVVLDECDTLLDDSFTEKLTYLLQKFPFYKTQLAIDENDISTQLILASATMPTNIEVVLGQIVDVSTVDQVVSPSLHKILPHIKQKFVRMRKAEKAIELLSLVKEDMEKRRPVIVFANRTATSDFISMFLNDNGIDAVSLNGDLLNVIREKQFKKFQEGEVNVLATTDVGSRGLDTTRAVHVINFDFPQYTADYIHRCGRIGREGSMKNCLITNFIASLAELDLVRKIEHTARTQGILPHVNANITNIINKRIETDITKEIKEMERMS